MALIMADRIVSRAVCLRGVMYWQIYLNIN